MTDYNMLEGHCPDLASNKRKEKVRVKMNKSDDSPTFHHIMAIVHLHQTWSDKF